MRAYIRTLNGVLPRPLWCIRTLMPKLLHDIIKYVLSSWQALEGWSNHFTHSCCSNSFKLYSGLFGFDHFRLPLARVDNPPHFLTWHKRFERFYSLVPSTHNSPLVVLLTISTNTLWQFSRAGFLISRPPTLLQDTNNSSAADHKIFYRLIRS